MSCKLCEGVGEIDTLGHQTVACPECVERDLEAKIERLKTIVDACAVSDDAPCYYCSEPVEPLAGDPGRWPLYFPQPDEPGVCKAHHVQCVLEQLAIVAKLPKTADGVPVVPGMTIWTWLVVNGEVDSSVQAVRISYLRPGGVYTDCYSTREAADAAAQGIKLGSTP